MRLIDFIRQLGFRDVELDDPPNGTVLANNKIEICFGGFPPHQPIQWSIHKYTLGSWQSKKHTHLGGMTFRADDPDLQTKVKDFVT